MMQLLANSIVCEIAANFRKSGSFAVMVDSTQDDQPVPQKDFVGMYEPPVTTGDILVQSVLDVLLHLQLLIDNSRTNLRCSQQHVRAVQRMSCFYEPEAAPCLICILWCTLCEPRCTNSQCCSCTSARCLANSALTGVTFISVKTV